MVWQGGATAPPCFLTGQKNNMASVRHLGLFPFCVGSYPPTSDGINISGVGDYTIYPFVLPVDKACAFWWRVKHWNVSFVYSRYRDLNLFSGELPGSYSQINATTISLNTESALEGGTLRTAITDEKKLVCLTGYEEATIAYAWEWQATQEFYIVNPAPAPPTTSTTTVTFQASIGTNATQQLGFFPPFAKQQDPDERQLWTAFYFQAAEYETLGTQTGAASGTFSLLGTDRTFAMQKTSPTGAGETTTLSSVTVTPRKFFAYDPRDGKGPIYDENTGRQLRGFPA